MSAGIGPRKNFPINTKREVNALKRSLTIQRVGTQSEMYLCRIQTRFGTKCRDIRLKKVSKRVSRGLSIRRA